MNPLVYRKVFTADYTIHLGIFHRQALWADSVPPPMNTITSCDQFKPITIGENFSGEL